MLPGRRRAVAAKRLTPAPLFAALGDVTRLALVAKLAAGRPCSIAQLTRGSHLTRQAISKHLHVLATAGVVASVREGRENRFALNPRPISELRDYLDLVSKQWDEALSRLKSFVEA